MAVKKQEELVQQPKGLQTQQSGQDAAWNTATGAAGTGQQYNATLMGDTGQQNNAALMGMGTTGTGVGAQWNAGSNNWYAQAQGIMDKINNRQPFNFDLNKNALYQMYKDQYQQQGQKAMRDTMGQAAGLTGGYGSSYGQMAGQMSYNDYLSKLNNIVPELYAQERAAYDADQQALYQQLGAAQGMYDRDYQNFLAQRDYDYQRSRDAVADSHWDTQFDYNRERDLVADNQWQQQFDLGKSQWQQTFDYNKSVDDRNYNYQLSRDQVADSQWQQQFDANRDDTLWNRNYQTSRDQVEDAWRQQQFDYNRQMDDRNYNYQLSRDSVEDAWRQQQFDYTRQMDDRSFNYNRERDALSDERYSTEWAAQQADSSYSRMMDMVKMGYMPSESDLAAAGIDPGYARYLSGMAQAGYGGGYGGGGYGGRYTASPQPEPPEETQRKTPPANGGASVPTGTLETLAAQYASGGDNAIAKAMNALTEQGYNVNDAWDWIQKNYKYYVPRTTVNSGQAGTLPTKPSNATR